VASAGARPAGLSLRAVQLGLALAVEAGWLLAWSAVLGAWLGPLAGPPLLAVPTVLALLVGAMLLTRRAAARPERGGQARLAVALLGLGLAVASGLSSGWLASGSSEPPAASVLSGRGAAATALALLAWWRGIVAGRARLSVDSTEQGLRLAVGGLAVLFVVQMFVPRDEGLTATLAGVVLLVLGAGLVGLPLAALLDRRERPRHAGAPVPPIGGQWLGLLLAAVGGLLALAVALARLLTFERLERLLQPLQPLGGLFWTLFYLLLLPLGLLLELLAWLLRLLFQRERSAPPRPPDMSWLDTLREQAEEAPPEAGLLLWLLGLAAAGLLAALLVWLLARAARGWADLSSDDGVDEVRDWVWSWQALRASLRARLLGLFGAGRAPVPTDGPAAAQAGGRTARSGDGIRPLYRRLLGLGARLERRREPDETPYEYERALAARGPLASGRAEVGLLTRLYVRARYGAAPPGPTALAEARAALERLEVLASGSAPTDEGDSPAPRPAGPAGSRQG
jgi:hypothetical protein